MPLNEVKRILEKRRATLIKMLDKEKLPVEKQHQVYGAVKEIENVAVLGAGAMGAFYASKFFDAQQLSSVLVAREPRYDRLKNEVIVHRDLFTWG